MAAGVRAIGEDASRDVVSDKVLKHAEQVVDVRDQRKTWKRTARNRLPVQDKQVVHLSNTRVRLRLRAFFIHFIKQRARAFMRSVKVGCCTHGNNKCNVVAIN